MTEHEPRQKNFLIMSGVELRAAREEMGMTQREMAEKYEISVDGYKQYELGRRPIPGPVKMLTKMLLRDHRNIAK
jgi:transcriptional regulator with XRE-family HTH domain